MAKNKPRRILIFWLFRLSSIFIAALPLRAGLKLGQYLGKFSFYILKRERIKALNNLDIAFGGSKSIEEKRAIALKVFENLGKNFIEVISLPRFNKYNIDKYITCKNFQVMEDFLKEGKGLMILSAHFGNWELLAHYLAIKRGGLNVIARRIRMERFEAFLDGIRRRNKVNVIYRDGPVKEIIDILKNNEVIGIMPDQDMDSVSGVFVDFFDRPAYTASGLAVLAYLTGAPIMPCFIIRFKFGHEIVLENLIKLSWTGNRDKDILENVQRYTAVIESYIRRFPSQWVWFHERWKTRKI